MDPGCVGDGWDFDWQDVVVPKSAAFCLSPGEGVLVDFEDVMGELDFFGP